jgi:hypothetical protein
MTAVLLAHQGGWDEILMVLVPIALFAGLLAVANRRASAIETQRDGDGGGAGGGGEDGHDGHARAPLPPRDEPTDR